MLPSGREYIHETRPEREEVLRPFGVAPLDVEILERPRGQRRDGNREERVPVERTVLERVGLVPGLLQVALLEGVDVGDDRAAVLEPGQLLLQRRRVHGDQHARRVARRGDLVVADVDLERRDAGEGALGRPDLGRELGQGGQVVAEEGALGGETGTGELHAVAGVTGEANHHPINHLHVRGRCGGLSQGISRGIARAGVAPATIGR